MIAVRFESHATSIDNEAGLASGHYDVALSPAGERQAAELGRRYAGSGIRAVYCSDLQRSYRTAELAFAECAIEIVRDRRLRECDYGEFTRRPRSEFLFDPVEWLDRPFPGGESYRDAARRVREFLQDVAKRNERQSMLIIGHRATQYALEHWLKGRPLEQVLSAPWQWQPGWMYELDRSREPWI